MKNLRKGMQSSKIDYEIAFEAIFTMILQEPNVQCCKVQRICQEVIEVLDEAKKRYTIPELHVIMMFSTQLLSIQGDTAKMFEFYRTVIQSGVGFADNLRSVIWIGDLSQFYLLENCRPDLALAFLEQLQRNCQAIAWGQGVKG